MTSNIEIARHLAYYEDLMRHYASLTSQPWDDSHFKLACESADAIIRSCYDVGRIEGVEYSSRVLQHFADQM